MFGDGGTADDLIGVEGEVFEERVFPRGQDHRLAAPEGPPRARVEFERADANLRRTERTLAPADDGTQSRQHSPKSNGLVM